MGYSWEVHPWSLTLTKDTAPARRKRWSRFAWMRGKDEMKRLVVTTYLMIALIGPSLAQDVAAVGKKAKPKQSSECRPVGTVKGTKLWAGNCVAPELAAAPAAEPESEPETKDAIRGSK